MSASFGDYSVTVCSTSRTNGNKIELILTGNGLDAGTTLGAVTFQNSALRAIQSIIRSHGYPDYVLADPTTAETGSGQTIQFFCDVVGQTAPTNEDTLISFLQKFNDYTEGDTSAEYATLSADTTFVNLVTYIVNQSFLTFTKAAETLCSDDGADQDLCGSDNGRIHTKTSNCIFCVSVNVQ